MDVGGTQLLKKFFTGVQIISLNIDDSGDVRYDGGDFPYTDSSFDAVVSLDTLEHIPRANRQNFIGECLRVARKGVIIAAPYGSAAHRQNEAELCKYLEQAGRPNRWLAEHVQHGIPTPDEVLEYQKLFKNHQFVTTSYYAGDYIWQSQNLNMAISLNKLGLPERLANLISFALGLRIWHPNRFSTQPTAMTNRFYLFGVKASTTGEHIGL